MTNAKVKFNKDDEYYTPKSVVEYFGKFDYDPATCEEKAKEFDIKNYDTIVTNGLTKDWTIYKNIWINPPFTEKDKFLEKAYQTYKIAKNNIYVLFPIEFITTKKFYNITKNFGGKIYIPRGRINFEKGLGMKCKSPAFGSVIMKIQEKWEIEIIDKDLFKEEK